MKAVKELSKLTGVSVRTLHYYDEIELLKPAMVNELGHRMYSENEEIVLNQILLFRELGLSLKNINGIINGEDFDIQKVIECQKKLLTLKRNRLNHLIEQLDHMNLDENPFMLKELDFEETEWELIWNEIYTKQGEVQSDVLPTVIDFVKELKKDNVKKILDLGCGTGRNAVYLAKNGFHVTATDISEKGLLVTKNKAIRYGLPIETVCHDIRNIPFKDNTFDAILCSWVSGHGNHEDMAMHANEMLRVVKENGLIFVDYPSKNDERYGTGIEIEKDTFLDNMPGEEKIPHQLNEIYRSSLTVVDFNRIRQEAHLNISQKVFLFALNKDTFYF